MNNAYRNSEHYYDPTAGTAISNVLKAERAEHKAYRPLVYICSRYAGDVECNVLAARKYCRFAVEQNAIPLAPHLLYPQFLDDASPKERELGLFFGKVLLDKCDELWVFTDGEYSAGMTAEHNRAIKRGYKIRYFDMDCCEITSREEDAHGPV